VPTGVHATPSNLRYLSAKVEHTHHTIALAEAGIGMGAPCLAQG
jgi:GTP cyclohydrolase II